MESVIIVIIIRILAPLAILRWPFWGAILAIIADSADLLVFDLLGYDHLRFSPDLYHPFDKVMDTYYLSLEFLVALRWQNQLARRTAIVLFIWRFVGFALFEITQHRVFFFFAPNIFENFYLFWVVILKYFPDFKLHTKKQLAAILFVVSLPKVVQEYQMHYLEFETWRFIKDRFLFWLLR